MTQIKNWVAIVPARKGSKRLPNKNLLKLGNQSLVEIAVQKALDTNIFEKVIISSDSQEIVVAPIPNKDVGLAINDKLKRASS